MLITRESRTDNLAVTSILVETAEEWLPPEVRRNFLTGVLEGIGALSGVAPIASAGLDQFISAEPLSLSAHRSRPAFSATTGPAAH